jgi:hypothetical protein
MFQVNKYILLFKKHIREINILLLLKKKNIFEMSGINQTFTQLDFLKKGGT